MENFFKKYALVILLYVVVIGGVLLLSNRIHVLELNFINFFHL